MIPRTLVPVKLLPPSATPAEGRRRTSSFLDERQIIPAELPVKGLETDSNIPSHFPLDVVAARMLVPREAAVGILEMPVKGQTLLPTDADERIAVPVDAHPDGLNTETALPFEVLEHEDLVTADVFTTGNVTFLPREVSDLPSDSSWLVPAGSVVVHVVLVLAILGLALMFPHREPTQAELEAASRDLGIVYLPDSMFNQRKASPKPPGPPAEKLRVDPNAIKRVAPEIASPAPAPAPAATPKPTRELPSAPVPQIPQQPNGPPPQQQQVAPRIDSVKPVPDAPTPNFKLPSASPGRALEDSMRGATNHGGSSGATFGGSLPRGTGGIGGGGGGGGGDGYLGGAVQMLTPDEGVDFSSYLARVVASVKRYWYSVMPESARMGDRGRAIIDFKIMRDGTVPMPEPVLRMTSGKEPLDRAALNSIRGASPFEPLPGQFSGPYIELRFIFLYNLPLDAAQ
jgi:TonB family protein